MNSYTLKFKLFKTHTTCEFDLVEENADIKKYLPNECQNIEIGSIEYADLYDEAIQFNDFNMLLNQREEQLDSNYIQNSENIPERDWKFRYEMYEKADLTNCNLNETILSEFVNCIIRKRIWMIQEFIDT